MRLTEDEIVASLPPWYTQVSRPAPTTVYLLLLLGGMQHAERQGAVAQAHGASAACAKLGGRSRAPQHQLRCCSISSCAGCPAAGWA